MYLTMFPADVAWTNTHQQLSSPVDLPKPTTHLLPISQYPLHHVNLERSVPHQLSHAIKATNSCAESIWAASPSTTRGQPTQLSSDAKGERLAYAVRSLFDPDRLKTTSSNREALSRINLSSCVQLTTPQSLDSIPNTRHRQPSHDSPHLAFTSPVATRAVL